VWNSIRNPQSVEGERQMEKRRATLSLVLTAVGAALLVYGLGFRASVATSSDPNTPASPGTGAVTPARAIAASGLSELTVTQEVARGGLKRDESGRIKTTYEKGKPAPAACPT
jgi:hypothetical protein